MELIVVIAIIGIIAVIIYASWQGVAKKSRDSRRIGDINAIQNAVKMYYLEEKKYPQVDNASCYSRARSCDSASWERLGVLLQKHISPLPSDPSNADQDTTNRPIWQNRTNRFFYTFVSTKVSYVLAARMEREGSGNYSDLSKENIAPPAASCGGLSAEGFEPSRVVAGYDYYFQGENLIP